MQNICCRRNTLVRLSARGLPMLAMLLLAVYLHVGPAFSDSGFTTQAEQDAIFKNVRVDEKLGAYVPLDLAFTNQDGKAVRLRDYFTGRPVVLSLNYYRCPMLCPLTFSNLSRTIDDIPGLSLGRDFRVVTVSFDPEEKLDTAMEKSAETYKMLKGVKDPGDAWPFLFGGEGPAAELTKAVGFRFVKLGPGNFAHPTAQIVLGPDGKITRYLYGIKQDPMDLRLALTEAADGRIGQSRALNQVLLFCYHYDPVGKRYAIAAMRIMKAVGIITALALSALLFTMWRLEKARNKGLG